MKLWGIIGLTSGAIGTLFWRGPWTSLGWNTGLGTFILWWISKLAGKWAKLIDKISNKIANVFS